MGYCKRLSTHESVKLQELYKHLHGMNSTIHHYQHKLDASEQLVGELKEVLLKKDTKILNLRDNIKNLKATPFGSRERKRGLSSIETLAPRSGAPKRRVTTTRYVLHYVLICVNSRSLFVEICLSICKFLCLENFLLDACGITSNKDRIILLMSLLNKEDVLSIMRAPKGKVIREAVTTEVMKKFSNLVLDIDIQSACDEVGISTRGYEAIHQLLKDSLRKNGITKNLF